MKSNVLVLRTFGERNMPFSCKGMVLWNDEDEPVASEGKNLVFGSRDRAGNQSDVRRSIQNATKYFAREPLLQVDGHQWSGRHERSKYLGHELSGRSRMRKNSDVPGVLTSEGRYFAFRMFHLSQDDSRTAQQNLAKRSQRGPAVVSIEKFASRLIFKRLQARACSSRRHECGLGTAIQRTRFGYLHQ